MAKLVQYVLINPSWKNLVHIHRSKMIVQTKLTKICSVSILFISWWCHTGWVKRVILILSYYLTLFRIISHLSRVTSSFWYYFHSFCLITSPFCKYFHSFNRINSPFWYYFHTFCRITSPFCYYLYTCTVLLYTFCYFYLVNNIVT